MYSLGLDVGTSGIRAVIMDKNHCILTEAQYQLPPSTPYYSKSQQITGYSQSPEKWWNTFKKVILKLSDQLLKTHQLKLDVVTHLAIDGTSGTVLLCDIFGEPVTEALMYNDQRAVLQAAQIKQIAPKNTAAIGTTSGLAKILWLYEQVQNKESVHYALNQADWLNGKLMSEFGFSDYNNALKMGYDAQKQCWPNWLNQFLQNSHFPSNILPKVIKPGQIIGKITHDIAVLFGFSPELKICAGTTDSTAAIIATGAENVGDAVTSLGSTLVMKIVSNKPIFDHNSGVYSQPFGELWLVGGSSNSGGEVLKQLFDTDQVQKLTDMLNIKINQECFSLLNLNYYPLLTPGERFPIQDPDYAPRLSPVPDNSIDFFQACLEGMSDIETMAYEKLVDLGAPYPKLIKSIGGGAHNIGWRYIRELKLGVPVKMAKLEQAAAGTALLAQTTWQQADSLALKSQL